MAKLGFEVSSWDLGSKWDLKSHAISNCVIFFIHGHETFLLIDRYRLQCGNRDNIIDVEFIKGDPPFGALNF